MSASVELDKKDRNHSATPDVVTDPGRRHATARLLAQIAATTDEGEQNRLRDEIVVLNMRMARVIVSRYRDRGVAHEDLLQAAYLGLVKAVRGFDPTYERDFLAYATPTVTGEVKRYFRDFGWTVRPPRRIQQLQATIFRASNELSQTLHRSPKPREVADFLSIDEYSVIEALTAADGCFTPTSLDTPVGENDSGSLAELLGAEDPELRRAEARLLLAPAVRKLTAENRRIIHLRFICGWTQEQIGEELGVTQLQVSRLLTRILKHLRAAIDDKG